MSYDISLYSIKTKEKYNPEDEDFFENEENIVPFTEQQFQELKERLLQYGYEIVNETNDHIEFNHPDEDYGLATLCNNVLSFSANGNGNSIFEVGMTASEFTDTGEFAKFDFQNGDWETWE